MWQKLCSLCHDALLTNADGFCRRIPQPACRSAVPARASTVRALGGKPRSVSHAGNCVRRRGGGAGSLLLCLLDGPARACRGVLAPACHAVAARQPVAVAGAAAADRAAGGDPDRKPQGRAGRRAVARPPRRAVRGAGGGADHSCRDLRLAAVPVRGAILVLGSRQDGARQRRPRRPGLCGRK